MPRFPLEVISPTSTFSLAPCAPLHSDYAFESMKPTSAALMLFLSSSIADGAGFQLQERSAKGLGRAYSGEAAIADDASVLASNPAAILLVPGETATSVGLTGIYSDVNVNGTFTPAGAPAGVPARADDITEDSYIPYLFVVRKISERLSLGFGSYTTFGLQTDYPISFSGRSIADLSDIKTVNLNPAIAFRLNDKWSIGAGIDALYAEGTLDTTLPNGLPLLELTGDDWGYGYNIGILYDASERTRFGLHYRSTIDLLIDGQALSVIPGFNGPAKLDVTLPDQIEFSAYHELNESWAIHGDVIWTGWSTFDQLVPIIAGAPIQPPATTENFSNAWRFSIGATWRITDALTLRAGAAYDESPADPAYRNLRIPDSDRIWLSAGLSYQFNPCWALDFGYTHLVTERAVINETTSTGNFTGVIEGSAHLVSLGLSGTF